MLVGGTLIQEGEDYLVRAAIDGLGSYALFLESDTGTGDLAVADLACQPRMISPRGGGFAPKMAVSFTLGRSAEMWVRVFDTAGHLQLSRMAGHPSIHNDQKAGR